MKNIVNRALVAKKKQFQSKSVPRGTRTIWRYLGALFILFTFAIGQMWGADVTFTYNQFVAAGTTDATSGLAAKSSPTPETGSQKMYNGAASKESYIKIGSGAGTDISKDKGYLEISAPSGKVISSLVVYGATNSDTDAGTEGYVCWDGSEAISATNSIGVGAWNFPNRKGSSTTPNSGTISCADGTRIVRLYRKVTINSTDYGSSVTPCITSVKVTYASSCTKPGIPGTLSVSSKTHNSANLTWTAAANSDGYKVSIVKKSDASVIVDWTDCATNSYAASGLDPETTYTFKVKAKGATDYCDLGDEASADFATEVDPSATTYKVTLVPAGGTISDATGWTLNAGNYEKEVSSGTELALPTFTKANRTFKTWRNGVDVTSPITITEDVTLTAVWNATVEQVLYSWEGGSPATEVGGTAVTKAQDGTDAETSDINVDAVGTNATYKSIKLGGKISSGAWSGNYIQITTDEAIKTGDKVKITACTTKGDTSKKGSAQIRVGTSATGTAIVSDGGTYNDIKVTEDVPVPNTKTFTITAEGINTSTLSMTRQSTNTNCWVTKLQIIREVLVEEGDLLTVTFDANGGSAVASAVVASGQTVAKPADPTWAKHRFNEWQLSGSTYNFSSPVTSNITLVANWTQLYTISFAAGEGSGDAPAAVADKAQGETFTVPANTYDAPTGKVFAGWNDGSADYAEGDTYTVGTANVILTAQWIANNFEAKIGTTFYTTLAEALAHAADGEIVLLKSCDVTSQLEIAAGVTATIDLNGYTIEYTGSTTLPSGVILVHNGASLTINDSSDPSAGSIVSGDKAYAAVALTKLGDDASNPATLVVNGGALTGYYYGITGNGSRNNTDITINGGTITGTVGIAIYHPQVGTLTVNDGSLTGVDAAIEMRAGTLVINDGTFTATATEFSCISNGSGSTTTGAAIAIAQHTTKKEISVTINGGTFNGVKALNESNPQVNDPAPQVTMAVTAGTFTGEVTTVDVNNFISGGTFDHEVAANQCAEGYAPKDNGDNTYGVKPLAQTFSLEDLVTNQGTGANYTTYLNNLGWTVASADALDKLNTDKDYDNYPYLGLKFKNAAGYVAGEVEGGKLLTIKLGHMAGVAHLMVDDVKKMELDGVDAETPKVHYYYVENTANVKLLMANAGSSKTCVLKAITVADPFTVTFDANGGEDVASLNGTPSVTLPSATKGTDSFLGWFDGETKVGEAGDTYTPTANITLVAHWEAVSTDARLASISFSSDAGTLAPAFDPEVTNYTYTMPYGTASVPTITGATAVNANAQAPVIGTAATAWGEAQTVKGVAQSGAEKIYTVTILRAPKDGVCIIKGNVGNNTFVIDEDASLFAGTADKNNVRENSSTYQEKIGWKFQARPARLGLTLSGDETFQKGDVVEVFVTSVADIQGNNDKMRIFDANDATAAHVLYESEADMIQGANRFVLPATTTKSLYLHRTNDADYDNFNPYVAYVAVYRPMNPVMTAITINGVACDKGEGNAFSVTLPNGTNLGSLTVVPTIVKNGEGGSAAPTAAWAWEDNTYRVTDKDGDYTDYTITLTEAAAPSAAPVITAQPEGADYIEGASIAALEVVATGSGELSYQWYLGAEAIEGATAATYAPAVSAIGSYVYHCVVTNTEAGHPATSLASDNATITISENSNAIKLFDGEGNLNTTNFISPAKTTIEIADVEHVCLAEFSSNRSSLGGATPTDMVKYDVTTDKAKIQMTFYNNNSGTKKAILYKYEEGGTPEKIEIEVPGQQIFTTEYYEFNSSKNRTFYVCMNDRSNIRVLQVKVIDNGANPVKQFGQVGYSLNLNKARFYAKAAVEKSFEGFTFTPSSDYKVYNNSNLATTSANSFTIASPTVMSVKRSGGKYYVYQDPADKGTLYSADAEIELNATGTWYISSETTSSAASFTKIEFLAPKCEKPTITTQPATKLTFDPGDLTATVVAAEPTDGGTLSYQWYNAANDEEVEGATEATLTTTTPGTYYVVVTNTLAGHQDVSVTSEEAELGYRVTSDATLKSLKYGTTAIALEDGVYDYNVELAKGTTDVPALAATATMNGYATVTISNAAEFVSYAATSTVTVKSEDLTVTNVYTVNFTVKHDLPQVDVTGSTVWNWTNAATTMQTIKPATKNVEQLMANIDDNGKKLKNDDEFNSQALIFSGQEALVGNSTRWYAKGGHIKFNVTVPGIVKVEFSDNGGNNRRLKINNLVSDVASASETDVKTYAAYVEAGEVTLMGVKNDGTGTDQYIRISKITFTAKATPDYSRDVTNNIGTLCVDHNVLAGGALGATFYQIASRNELYNDKIDFEEVLPNEELKAGEPYIFKSTTGKIELFYGATAVTEPEAVRGMHGWFDVAAPIDETKYDMLDITEENKSDILYIAQNKLWNCEDLVTGDLKVVNNRAYIVMSEVPTYADYQAAQTSNPAPRRRVTLGRNAEQVATGIEDVQGDKVQCTKMLINGQLFILRGEKMYDAKGQLVK